MFSTNNIATKNGFNGENGSSLRGFSKQVEMSLCRLNEEPFRSIPSYWTNIVVEQRTDMKSVGNEGLLEIKWVEIQKCLSQERARNGTIARRK
jgi:hypothetical protein